MKKCSWCGAEYPDDVTLCPVDQREVIDPSSPKPTAPYAGIRVMLLNLRGDPAPAQPPIPRSAVVQIFELFFRYLAALLVGGIVSFTVIFCAIMIGFIVLVFSERFFYPSEIVLVAACCITGFVASCIGTFSGALVLPRGKRAFGSIAFVIIGAAYCMILTVEYILLPHKDYEIYIPAETWVLWGCGVSGGLLTVFFFNWGRWPKFSPRGSVLKVVGPKKSEEL